MRFPGCADGHRSLSIRPGIVRACADSFRLDLRELPGNIWRPGLKRRRSRTRYHWLHSDRAPAWHIRATAIFVASAAESHLDPRIRAMTFAINDYACSQTLRWDYILPNPPPRGCDWNYRIRRLEPCHRPSHGRSGLMISPEFLPHRPPLSGDKLQRFEQTIGNFLQETRREYCSGSGRAACGFGKSSNTGASSHESTATYIKRTLLFQPSCFISAVIMREQPLLQFAQENAVEFQPFVRIHGHQLERILTTASLMFACFERGMARNSPRLLSSASCIKLAAALTSLFRFSTRSVPSRSAR